MMHVATSFAAGLVFGAGLIVSGMANPAKVLGFLDLAGAWDPSLALVMGGAIVVGFFGFLVAKKRTVSLLGAPMKLPDPRLSRHIDKRLVIGSLLFGAGWGLAGFCPGPALVSLGSGQDKGAWFVLAMLTGMLLYEAADRMIHAPRRTAHGVK